MAKKKSKAEELHEAVAEAVGAGRELHLESVDFSDPNRPKTCLEVDFPILHINQIGSLEATSGAAKKPIYQMSKWWARRQSSIFRAILIAAATRAPEDHGEAAKIVWDAYYGNHQKNEAFRKLKVADIFMGGGTTVVEGARLGMQMYGNDLNPVSWMVVKNELAQVDPKKVQTLLDAIEAEVKPQIMPFFACDCPRGHKGKWTHKRTGKVMEEDFAPLCLTPEQRLEYEYEGPEIIYTFWAMHCSCVQTECNHRTPIMSSPIVASRSGRKAFTIKAWHNYKCSQCGTRYDIEATEARLCPRAPLVISRKEDIYAVMDAEGKFNCPNCGRQNQDVKARVDGKSAQLGKAESKKISLTVVVHPEWVAGLSSAQGNSPWQGGSAQDTVDTTLEWNRARNASLSLVEVRGEVLEGTELQIGNTKIRIGKMGGTVRREKYFTCQNETCGKEQLVLTATSKTKKTRPASAYAVQIYCPFCDKAGHVGNGRMFDWHSWHDQFSAAHKEWAERREGDLSDFWPRQEIPFGSRTHVKDPLPKHGYSHWWTMFNSRQLLVHSLLLKSLRPSPSISGDVRLFVMGAFQQYLRCNNMFTIWHTQNNQISAFLSNSNFNPKNTVVETAPFAPAGDGSWNSAVRGLIGAMEWKRNPWELVPTSFLDQSFPHLARSMKGKSEKVYPKDLVGGSCTIDCKSSTELVGTDQGLLDLVITDPPFGNLIQYSELSDFFYVWLRLGLKKEYPQHFSNEFTPRTLEAVSNESRHGTEADDFYAKVLTECWKQCGKKLSHSGLLAFTFHHSEDEPWLAVLKSLFEAGFFLEATFPIRSDETKGQGEFGSQKIEFDIVHVCRKRLEEPEPISWARLRRQIMRDVRQLQEIIEQHQKEGLGEADLQVIRRGKALEYYSRHYGKVYIEKGREDEFTVKDALVGINQLLEDEKDTTSDAPPVLAEPYTRQFLRLFAGKTHLERDQVQKYLRGTGVSPSEFVDRGWCTEERKVFHVIPPLQWAQQWKGKSRGAMSRDFDQCYFLIGACFDESGIKVTDTLNSGSFVPHPAINDLLDWFGKHGFDQDVKDAARRAKQIYSTWLAKNTKQVLTQQTLFDFLEDE